MTVPDISIIIPVYKAEQYLRQCLDSIVNQTHQNIEIICVNDGSPDKSLEILQDYDKKDSRIRIIDQKNQGASSARNNGIELSTGRYIMFVDADDWIDRETCEMTYAMAENNHADIVIWPYIKEYANSSVPKPIFEQDMVIFENKDIREFLHRRICGLIGEELKKPEMLNALSPVWGKLYHQNVIKEFNVRFESNDLIGVEDGIFNFIVFNHIKKAVYINQCYYHYRKNNQASISKTYNPRSLELFKNQLGFYQKNIDNNNLGDSYQLALNNRVALSFMDFGLNELASSEDTISKIKAIKRILLADDLKARYRTLPLKHLSIHWKVFYGFVKVGFASGVFVMLSAIRKILSQPS
jgi:glycosyltransferase EpsH